MYFRDLSTERQVGFTGNRKKITTTETLNELKGKLPEFYKITHTSGDIYYLNPTSIMKVSYDDSNYLVLDMPGFTLVDTNADALANFNNARMLDKASYDAFGRQRTSETGQRLDVEFLYDKQPDFFDEITNNGTVTFNATTRDLTLSLGDAVDGSYAAMASHPIPYTPGNSQLIDITGVLDLAAIGGGNAEFFLRSSITGSAVEEVVAQADWINLTEGVDWTTSHIFSMDFQSLKVGTIRFFLVQDGSPIQVGSIHNDNERDSGYWQIPNLPVYWKIYNDATYTYMEMGYGNDDNAIGFRYKIAANASATMKAICCTVKSESGISLQNMEGLPRSIDNGVTSKSVSTTLIPLLSIRPKSTFNTLDNLAIALPRSISISPSNPIRLVVIHDGTLTTPSWADVDDPDSMMEYDVSATAVSGGHVVFSDYFTTTSNNRSTSSKSILGKTVLWNRKSTAAGITGVLTIAAVRYGGVDSSCVSAIQWDELR